MRQPVKTQLARSVSLATMATGPAHLAAEAFRVPLGAERSDEALHDGLLAALAPRGKLLVVALAAERLAVLLVETLRPKVLPTQSAEEVLLVPCLVQCSQHTLRGREGETGVDRGREGERGGRVSYAAQQ